MRILITGANGNLGRQLISRLGNESANTESDRIALRVLVRSKRAADTVRSVATANAPELVIGDYTDPDFMRGVIEDCQVIIHLVGIIKESSGTDYESAHESTCRILADSSPGAGVKRTVYLSILGSHPDSPNPCLASKGRAEQLLVKSECPSTILRVPMVLGPEDYASASLKRQACSKFVALVGGGRTLQQPIDSEDVVDAILAAALTNDEEDVELNLGGPRNLSQRDLVLSAGLLHGRRPLIFPIPMGLTRFFVRILERMSSNPPITTAMLEILQHDDRVDSESCCQQLGIRLTPLDTTLSRYIGPE